MYIDDYICIYRFCIIYTLISDIRYRFTIYILYSSSFYNKHYNVNVNVKYILE